MKRTFLAILVAPSLLFVNMAHAAPLSAPSNLNATPVSSSEINITWNDTSSKGSGFELERGTDGINFNYLNEVEKSVESYSDADLTDNTTYYYRVRAFIDKKNSRQYSDYSNVTSNTTLELSPPVAPPAPDDPSITPQMSLPNAPSTLVAQSFMATSSPWVHLGWSDNADNEEFQDLERSVDGMNFTLLVSLGINFSSYSDFAVVSGTTYYYRVKARNVAGSSEYSNTASTTTP